MPPTSELGTQRESTQDLVRRTLAGVGGYWPPLAAVARLLEELGELGECLADRAADPASRTTAPTELAGELADLWIITTAVADQFLAEVPEPGSVTEPDSRPRRDRTAAESIMGLVSAASRIARIVNYYDGPKTPRSLVGWVSLGDAVRGLHRELAELALVRGIDLHGAVMQKLSAIPTRDAGRFTSGYHDPRTAPSVQAFELAYAERQKGQAKLRLWGAPAWTSSSVEENVGVLIPSLLSFTRAATPERLEGYVIAGPAFSTQDLLIHWRETLLSAIAEHDPSAAPTVQHSPARPPTAEQNRAYDAGERPLTFNDLNMSVLTFSPLCEDTRRGHSAAGAFIVLSPDGMTAMALRLRERRGG